MPQPPSFPSPKSRPEYPIFRAGGFKLYYPGKTLVAWGFFFCPDVVGGDHPHQYWPRHQPHELSAMFQRADPHLRSEAFLVAQLRWNAIPHSEEELPVGIHKEAALRDILRTALLSGQCSKPLPQSIIAIEKRLRKTHVDDFQVWQRRHVAWEEQSQGADDPQWEGARTPTEQAWRDFDRFVKYYFLKDDDGTLPDKRKTTQPIPLESPWFEDAEKVNVELRTKWPDVGLVAWWPKEDQTTLLIGWREPFSLYSKRCMI
ncbi:hypothetical protein QBC36DRAFT_380035 [Triangularia setosa]|uniref:Uncharacterized protein n=1 Tax=Triangularia setosa TaxID=2587417 RepID=A0AAN6W3B0_9PEZI|nr:hypothetical protein QBC36DRAFT_380035 [Podospora setosa]